MLISIITVNYNDCKGLHRTLKSVKMQTCYDYELIIIDGGSTDGSKELIEQYQDIINYSESAKDGGPFFGMNKGIEHATGDYCIFMNAGDSFYDEHVLEKFVNDARDKDIYTGVAAEHLGKSIHQWNPPYTIDLSLKFFYHGALSHQSSFIKTLLLKNHPYDTHYRIAADWKFFLEMLIIQHASFSPLPFFVSHYMDGGISRDAAKAFAEREAIIDELFSENQKKIVLQQLRWDEMKQMVDPVSKIGQIIVSITKSLLAFRNIIHK